STPAGHERSTNVFRTVFDCLFLPPLLAWLRRTLRSPPRSGAVSSRKEPFMSSPLQRWSVLCAVCLSSLIAATTGRAADPTKQAAALSERELAARIDQHIGDRLKQRKVPPAPVTGDAAFIRRVYLDLAGRIPN